MITHLDFEGLFPTLTPGFVDILSEVHNLVMESSPHAAVEIRRYGIVYYDATRGGPVSAGICQTLIKPDHIRLAFIHGAFLPDPDHLLMGETYPKRYMKIEDYNIAPWDAIRQFIAIHCSLDPKAYQKGSF